MKNFALLLLYCSFGITSLISQNLVFNPSFEEYTELPTDLAQWNKCKYWKSPSEGATPDYYHSLSNIRGKKTDAHTGNACMALVVGNSKRHKNYREYITAELSEYLRAYVKYKISFWIKTGDSLKTDMYQCSGFGVGIANGEIRQEKGEVLDGKGWTYYLINNRITNGTWKRHYFYFTPNKATRYIAFGNFQDSTQISCDSVRIGAQNATIFIDDVEIYEALKIYGDTLVCKGIPVELKGSYSTRYKWYDAKDPQTVISERDRITVMPSANTTYILKSDSETDTLALKVYDRPSIYIGKDTSICPGEELTLTGSQAGKHEWFDNKTNNLISNSQSLTTRLSGPFRLDYWDSHGCKASDTINISYKESCNTELRLPNIITPNGDGLNDSFRPTKANGVWEIYLSIYNRWGDLIYDTIGISFDWTPDPSITEGTYFWHIKYWDVAHQPKQENGTLTIVR